MVEKHYFHYLHVRHHSTDIWFRGSNDRHMTHGIGVKHIIVQKQYERQNLKS